MQGHTRYAPASTLPIAKSVSKTENIKASVNALCVSRKPIAQLEFILDREFMSLAEFLLVCCTKFKYKCIIIIIYFRV